MIIIKAMTKGFEDWGNDADDFFVSFQLDIGPKEINGESYLYTVDIISPKRLQNTIQEGESEIGRGYIILTDYNENVIRSSIENIVKKCNTDNNEKAYASLSKYFRWEMDE